MTITARLLAAAALLALTAAPLAAQGAARPKLGAWGYDFTAMDKGVKPGDDFFRFANGTWLQKTQIDPDLTSAGGFTTLLIGAEADVHRIVEAMAAAPDASRGDRQVGDFYAAWMDQPGIEARGTAPLKPYLARIDAIRSTSDLVRVFAMPGFASPLGLSILPDPADPTRYTAGVNQGGLGMPNRDYYLLPGAKYDAFRTAYRAYVRQINELAGFPDAAGRTDRIFALETQLAKDYWAEDRRRDIKATTNPMNRQQLQALAPQVDWAAMLGEARLDTLPILIAGETTAITAVGTRLKEVPLATWKEYLAFRFVSDHGANLPRAFDDARFGFYGRTLSGQQMQRERWKRAVSATSGALGEQVGRIYVKEHYPSEAERQMAELIGDLRASYEARIKAASWMDEATRAQALEKLAAFDPRIGHPVNYIDYASMKVSRTDPLANAVNAADFQWKLQLSRMPKPVDRSLWQMYPQTVNAYYDPSMNQITFPAAILQPPFFDPAADPAVNYGAIGVVIGHEMGHGFDDQGREFDAKGKLRDWWTKAAADTYGAHTKVLVNQYNQYIPFEGGHVNGQLTLGENLGDLGGIEAAYGAYRRYVSRHGEPPVIDGLTGDQRFFLAYAQVWQGKRREGALRQQVLSDPHSPEEFRVNGIVRNFDPWYAAFAVKPGDKLYLAPDQRVHVW